MSVRWILPCLVLIGLPLSGCKESDSKVPGLPRLTTQPPKAANAQGSSQTPLSSEPSEPKQKSPSEAVKSNDKPVIAIAKHSFTSGESDTLWVSFANTAGAETVALKCNRKYPWDLFTCAGSFKERNRLVHLTGPTYQKISLEHINLSGNRLQASGEISVSCESSSACFYTTTIEKRTASQPPKVAGSISAEASIYEQFIQLGITPHQCAEDYLNGNFGVEITCADSGIAGSPCVVTDPHDSSYIIEVTKDQLSPILQNLAAATGLAINLPEDRLWSVDLYCYRPGYSIQGCYLRSATSFSDPLYGALLQAGAEPHYYAAPVRVEMSMNRGIDCYSETPKQKGKKKIYACSFRNPVPYGEMIVLKDAKAQKLIAAVAQRFERHPRWLVSSKRGDISIETDGIECVNSLCQAKYADSYHQSIISKSSCKGIGYWSKNQ